MNKSKKIFIAAVLLFFGFIAYISYDISSRTTFPGSKPILLEKPISSDTINAKDTVKANIKE